MSGAAAMERFGLNTIVVCPGFIAMGMFEGESPTIYAGVDVKLVASCAAVCFSCLGRHDDCYAHNFFHITHALKT